MISDAKKIGPFQERIMAAIRTSGASGLTRPEIMEALGLPLTGTKRGKMSEAIKGLVRRKLVREEINPRHKKMPLLFMVSEQESAPRFTSVDSESDWQRLIAQSEVAR